MENNNSVLEKFLLTFKLDEIKDNKNFTEEPCFLFRHALYENRIKFHHMYKEYIKNFPTKVFRIADVDTWYNTDNSIEHDVTKTLFKFSFGENPRFQKDYIDEMDDNQENTIAYLIIINGHDSKQIVINVDDNDLSKIKNKVISTIGHCSMFSLFIIYNNGKITNNIIRTTIDLNPMIELLEKRKIHVAPFPMTQRHDTEMTFYIPATPYNEGIVEKIKKDLKIPEENFDSNTVNSFHYNAYIFSITSKENAAEILSKIISALIIFKVEIISSSISFNTGDFNEKNIKILGG